MKSGTYSESDARGDAKAARHLEPEESDAFTKRLNELIGDRNRSQFARQCGFSESTLRTYLEGADPSRKRLIAIADAADVSIEWLAAGRGPRKRRVLHQVSGEQGGSGSADDYDADGNVEPLDLERLRVTIAAVEEGLRRIDRRLPPEKHAELVIAAYHLIGEPESDGAAIVELMRAVA